MSLWQRIKAFFIDMDDIFSPPIPAPPSPGPYFSVQPIVVNPTDAARLAQAAYRIDAISRYMDQTAEISELKRREFQVEVVRLSGMLLSAGKITTEAHDLNVLKVMAA